MAAPLSPERFDDDAEQRSLAGEGVLSVAGQELALDNEGQQAHHAAASHATAGAARSQPMANDPALELEWVLGCSTGSGSVAALDERRVLYISGNVGVIYHTTERSQTLLRGHVRDHAMRVEHG